MLRALAIPIRLVSWLNTNALKKINSMKLPVWFFFPIIIWKYLQHDCRTHHQNNQGKIRKHKFVHRHISFANNICKSSKAQSKDHNSKKTRQQELASASTQVEWWRITSSNDWAPYKLISLSHFFQKVVIQI